MQRTVGTRPRWRWLRLRRRPGAGHNVPGQASAGRWGSPVDRKSAIRDDLPTRRERCSGKSGHRHRAVGSDEPSPSLLSPAPTRPALAVAWPQVPATRPGRPTRCRQARHRAGPRWLRSQPPLAAARRQAQRTQRCAAPASTLSANRASSASASCCVGTLPASVSTTPEEHHKPAYGCEVLQRRHCYGQLLRRRRSAPHAKRSAGI